MSFAILTKSTKVYGQTAQTNTRQPSHSTKLPSGRHIHMDSAVIVAGDHHPGDFRVVKLMEKAREFSKEGIVFLDSR